MPASLLALLSSPEQAASDEASPASIPLIRSLSELDPNVKETHLCNANVQHISKDRREGNHFCGYRNIQIQTSYVVHTLPSAPECFAKIPSILRIQEMIEQAWDRGFNPNGRLQTGGIKDSRKHIGTQEACPALKNLSSGILIIVMVRHKPFSVAWA